MVVTYAEFSMENWKENLSDTGVVILIGSFVVSGTLGVLAFFISKFIVKKIRINRLYKNNYFLREKSKQFSMPGCGELFFINQESKDTIKKIHIEVAHDDYERTQGLMYRRSMADSLGMLFIFKEEEPQSFWMRNTYISLDIIYVDKQFEIVTIQKYTQPLTEWGYPSHKPAMYVVETNAGFCDRHKIKEGDRILYSTVK